MASGVINGTTSASYIKSKIEWESSPHKSGNKSSVTARLYYMSTDQFISGEAYDGYFSITINGTTQSGYKSVTPNYNSWSLAFEASVVVEHLSDGSKSVDISASGYFIDAMVSSTNCGGIAHLDSILYSLINKANNQYIGNSCLLQWHPKSTNFRYKVQFTMKGWEGISDYISPSTTSLYTYAGYTIPMDAARQLPNSPSGTMKVTLKTYNGNTEVGYDETEITVTVPDNSDTKPSINFDVEAINREGIKESLKALFIQGKSSVKATLSGAEAKYGASVISTNFSVEGKYYEVDTNGISTSGPISASGDIVVKAVVTDSRGYVGESTKTLSVYSYIDPYIAPPMASLSITCDRYDDINGRFSEEGERLYIGARKRYSSVGGNNTCLLSYRYRRAGESLSEWTILTTNGDGEFVGMPDTLRYSRSDTYTIELGVIDDVIGEYIFIPFIIPSEFVTIDVPDEFKGKRIAIFMRVPTDGRDGLYIGAPVFGGSLASLVNGEELPENTDLNNSLSPGCFYSEANRGIANLPDGFSNGFNLEVRELIDSTRQTVYYKSSTAIRHYDNATETWSEWLITNT